MNTIYIIFAFILLLSCSFKKNENNQFEQIIFSNEYISLSDSLEFKFIPLDTNDSCLIGYISDIQIRNNMIFILEGQKAEDIFIFDMNGKYISKISNKGSGPEQYIRIADFDIDTDSKLIILSDMHKENILFYDLNSFQFKYSIKTDFYYNKFILLPSNKFIFFGCNGFENPNNINDNESYHVLVSDSLTNPKSVHYKAEYTTPYTSHGIGKHNLYRFRDEVNIYHHLFPFTWIYKEDKIKAKYQIELENYNFPSIGYLKGESKIADKDKDYTQTLSNSDFIKSYMINESSDLISVSILKGKMPIQALYNKKSQKGYVLPLKEYFRSINFGMLMFPIGATDEHIIGYIQMNKDMERVKEESKLYKHIKNKTLEDNPILCLYKWN